MIKYLPVILLLCSLHLYAQPIEITCFDLIKGRNPSLPQYLSSCNGKMIFSAYGDTATGQELWISDGTIDGTHILKDILPGKLGSTPINITAVGNKAFFLASEKIYNPQLWVTDGTERGTIRLSNIDTDKYGGAAGPLATIDDHVLFWANHAGNTLDLWVSDGKAQGTVPILTFNGPNIPQTNGFVAYHNKIYFIAAFQSVKGQLWATDGTASGTELVDSFTIPSPSYGRMNACNDRLYFAATDTLHGLEPWVSDGTKAGTHIFTDLYPGPGSGYTGSGCFAYNGLTYFSGTDGSNKGMYATDGTPTGTHFVTSTSAAFADNYNTIFNNRMYFMGDSLALYVSDGTSNGTYPVRDSASNLLHLSRMMEYENKLYVITDVSKGHGLYRISKTDSVEKLVTAPERNSGTFYEKHFLAYNNALWIADMLDTASGNELWRIYDSTEISKPASIVTIYPNPNHGSFTISTADSNFTGRIHICDVAGREVYYNNHVSGPIINVTIPGAAAGVYFLTMQDISDPKTSRTISSYKIVVW